MDSDHPTLKKPFFGYLRYLLGVVLFALLVMYALRHKPAGIVFSRPALLLWTLPVNALLFYIQVYQFRVFLRLGKRENAAFLGELFTARKGVLNMLLPARVGTIALLPKLNRDCRLAWYDYPRFMAVNLVVGMFTVLACGLLLFRLTGVGAAVLAMGGLAMLATRRYSRKWARNLPILTLQALGVFLCVALNITFILNAMGYDLSLYQTAIFSVTLNALALISITPGNMGVREGILGWAAPYLALDVSYGILAGAAIVSIRMGVYAILWIVYEMLSARALKIGQETRVTGFRWGRKERDKSNKE